MEQNISCFQKFRIKRQYAPVTPAKHSKTVSYAGINKGAAYQKDRSFNEPITPPRERQSCVFCRQRKKKCSKGLPECDNCIAAGETCEYELDNRLARMSHKELVARVAWLEQVVNSSSRHQTAIEDIKTGEAYSTPVNSSLPLDFIRMGIMSPSPSVRSDDLVLPIDREVIIDRINAYLEHDHQAYPFVDRVLMDDFLQKDWNFESPVALSLMYLMAANGCYAKSKPSLPDGPEKKLANMLFEHGTRLGMENLKFDDFESIKYLVLIAVYSLFEPAQLSTWMIVGAASRLAVLLGLNRKACLLRGDEVYCPRTTEHRHRLFWSVYNLDRMISTSTGRPVSIQDQDIDMAMPCMTQAEKDSSKNKLYELDLNVSSSLIILSKLEGEIVKSVHSRELYISGADQQQTVVADFRVRIEDWYEKACKNATASMLEFGSVRSSHESQVWLLLRYSQLLLHLYGPIAMTQQPPSPQSALVSPKSPASSSGKSIYSAELCSAARQVIRLNNGSFKQKMLPLNWITLYRFLAPCQAIIYGFSKGLLDVKEATSDLVLCATMLEHFGSQWPVAKQCATVFRSISDNALLMEGNAETDVAKLLCTILGSASSFVNGADTGEQGPDQAPFTSDSGDMIWPEIGSWFDEQLNWFNENLARSNGF